MDFRLACPFPLLPSRTSIPALLLLLLLLLTLPGGTSVQLIPPQACRGWRAARSPLCLSPRLVIKHYLRWRVCSPTTTGGGAAPFVLFPRATRRGFASAICGLSGDTEG